jgi:hypothetical protein
MRLEDEIDICLQKIREARKKYQDAEAQMVLDTARAVALLEHVLHEIQTDKLKETKSHGK